MRPCLRTPNQSNAYIYAYSLAISLLWFKSHADWNYSTRHTHQISFWNISAMRAKTPLVGFTVVPKDLDNYLALTQNVQLHRGLESWLNNLYVQFPELTWWLTAICNQVPGSLTSSSEFHGTGYTHGAHTQTHTQPWIHTWYTHTYIWGKTFIYI